MQREPKLSPLFRPALVAAVVLLAARAEGSLVRYDFSGRITEGTASGPGWKEGEFTGTLIYDPSISLGESRATSWGLHERPYTSGVYRESDPIPDGTMLQLWLDGKAVAPVSTGLSGGLFTHTDGDGVTRSELVFQSHAREKDGAPQHGGISIRFKVDPALLASGRFPEGMTTADLPEARVSIENAMDGRFWDELTGGFYYGGVVESFRVTTAPEPAWTVAAMLAAAAWAARRRRVGR
ncbi:hypothetical protein [Paludisphaera sp.]|uniref:hypothetical protein n=1 Tax=Paludisphaera sp. TaxID=2017432 RepID=UPI00301BCDC6